MSGRSLLPLLSSSAEGQVEEQRTSVVTGRERHVADARADFLPYPQRAIRTHDYLYIRNFAPERWPMGDPRGLDDPSAKPPSYEELAADTMIAYADLDASPTKAWMIHHRAEQEYREMYELGFGKRPSEELYDVKADPWHMHNLADDPAHAATKKSLATELDRVLRAESDPRVTEEPCRYEHAPYAGPLEP
jgi:arylsulfatase A-like enzyme